MSANLADEIKQFTLDSGADLCGIADISGLDPTENGRFLTGISYAVAYDQNVIEGIIDGPNEEYRNAYRALNSRLTDIGEKLALFLHEMGFKALALKATTSDPKKKGLSRDLKPLAQIKVNLPHKTVATLAGIGWIGKTDLLVNQVYGPAIRLGTVLTDAPMIADEPIIESNCGECTMCDSACPVDAGRKSSWSRMKSDETYAVEKCYEYTKDVSRAERLGAQLCGICIAACPVGKNFKN